MKICRTIPEIRALVAALRAAGHSVGFVPTMGALHDGHMSLVDAALSACDTVIASIFVNPTQFGDPKDLETYPRTEEADAALLEARGVSAIFVPPVSEIYADGAETIVETTRLANMLHGEVRPGHYRGVCTVVTKLFNITQPDAAFFGEKDYQQLQVIRTMVRDLHMPVAIHGVATQRDTDGLALSSRNRRLAPEDRAAAPVLNRALTAAEAAVAKGTTVEALTQIIRDTIGAEPRASLRAVDIVAQRTLAPVSGPVTQPIAIMLSAEFGGILLIDQREISP